MPEKICHWHALSPEKVAETLKTDLEKGLEEKEVGIRQKFGLNKLPEEKPLSKIKILLSQLKSPLIYILLIAGIITLALKELTDSIVIFAAVFLNTAVGFFQEFKASNTLRELKKILKVKAVVLREGKEKQVLQESLVAGDIIILKAGDKVPADCRIFKSWNLKINEAPLTGEWLSAEKNIDILKEGIPLADRDNMAFMGTTVEEGEGRGVVISIGEKTELGKVSSMIKEQKEGKTPYQKKLSRFSKIVGIIIAVICVLIFIEGVLTGKEVIEMFITAVAVAVAAIPEGLPVAMTVILALGMQRILKKKGLVRKLASAETLGSTSVIATDKTLTLTEGKMKVSAVSGFDEKLILTAACLANEAFIENPEDKKKKWKIVGRPTDKALLEFASEKDVLRPALEKENPRVDEITFNTQNKFIASLHKNNTLYVSGAPEKIIELCSKVQKQRQVKIKKALLLKELEELTSKGLRVVALAQKKTKKLDVKDLVFLGFIGLKDPLRKEAKQAFKTCQKAGMRPIVVTGDHILTAKAVAKELGLEVKKENVMLGAELDELSDSQLGKRLKKINVFARVEPKHKMRIVSLWQEKNEIVAMTGDGINDAPALKKADIGVSLGSGTEVAKEVADLVLLDDNFSIIVKAVEQGRVILDNIRKVITYLLSDSFTEIILIAVGIITKLPLPVTAVQILWVNLLEDGLPNIALAFEPKEGDVMEQKPKAKDHPLLTKEMKVIIFAVGIITDLILLALFFFLFKEHGAGEIDHIRTIIFSALTIDSLFYVFSCKSLRKSIFHIKIFSNKLLIFSWFFGIFFLLIAVYTPLFQNILKTVPLGFYDWLILFCIGFINFFLIELTKYYFIAKHQTEV